jgi:hypothetical protein
VGPDETPPAEEWKELKKQVGDLQKGMSELVNGLRDRKPLSPRKQPQSGDKKPTGCFECGDPGQRMSLAAGKSGDRKGTG